jgi:predicted transcriptional regulator
MKLSKRVSEMVKTSTRTKTRVALALGVSSFTVDRYLDRDSDNLTKAAAMQIIREETGLADDQILEQDTVESK